MTQREVIGVVPMAGRATRISPLPCSKELYPVSLQQREGGARPKVVSHFLLERMRLAGIFKVFLVLRDGKWDIPAYYNDGMSLLNLNLAYLMARVPYGPPFTLDVAYPFVRDAIVAVGFPDILFSPDDTFVHVLARQTLTQADLVLGLFPLDQSLNDDMVEFDDEGRVRRYFIKQRVTHLKYTWIVAVWAPRFTQFMHDFLRGHLQASDAAKQELGIASVIQAAVDAGLVVQTITFSAGRFLDIGTPEGLAQMPSFS